MDGGERARKHVCENCRKKILQLERKIGRLEEMVQDKDAMIASLKVKQRQTTAELVEFQLQELQRSLCEKDSSLASMELQLQQSMDCSAVEKKQILLGVKTLQAERNLLTRQLKKKVSERFGVARKDSDEVLGAVAKEYRNYSRDQLCDELRSLDLTRVRLKTYIDQLLAVALETNPSLLEGMPRIQQSSGLKLELFSVASLTELLEELQDREENVQHLQHYASLLLQKLTALDPHLLDSVLIPKLEELGVAGGESLLPRLQPTVNGAEDDSSVRMSSHPDTGGDVEGDSAGLSKGEEDHQGGCGQVNGTATHTVWEGPSNPDPPLCKSL